MNLEEAQRVANSAGIDWDIFLADYIDHRWPGKASFLLKHQDGACIFLSKDNGNKQNLCLIHSFKPTCCREWESSMLRSDCQEGLKLRWDLSVNSQSKITGTFKDLENFERFLATV